MIGKPKFKEGDTVMFTIESKEKTGKVFVVDEFGIWLDRSDVFYDIMVEDENMLYKHIGQKLVRKCKR